jgi:MFS family permease
MMFARFVCNRFAEVEYSIEAAAVPRFARTLNPMTTPTRFRVTSGHSRVVVVLLLLSFSLISYFDRTIISIAGPVLMRQFGISETGMGTVFSAFILGYALLMIPGGYLTDRFGARRTLLIMGAGSAILTGALVFAATPGLGALIGVVPAMFAFRFGLGIVTAPLYPACARMVSHWIPIAQHARVQGLIIAGSAIGAAISPLLFTWLIVRFGWQGSFLIAAVSTGVLTLAWFLCAREYPGIPGETNHSEPSRPIQQSWAILLTDRRLLLLTIAYGALGYFQYIFFYWTFYYFGQVRHVALNETATYTTILFVTEGVMMPIGGWISDFLTHKYGPQIGRRLVPISGVVLSAACTYAGTMLPGTIGVVTCLSLAFGLAAACEGPFWAMVTEMAPSQVGAASSILNTGAQIGGFFSPILTPMIASRAGWSWGLYAGSLVALSGAVAVYLLDVRPRPAAARTATQPSF